MEDKSNYLEFQLHYIWVYTSEKPNPGIYLKLHIPGVEV